VLQGSSGLPFELKRNSVSLRQSNVTEGTHVLELICSGEVGYKNHACSIRIVMILYIVLVHLVHGHPITLRSALKCN